MFRDASKVLLAAALGSGLAALAACGSSEDPTGDGVEPAPTTAPTGTGTAPRDAGGPPVTGDAAPPVDAAPPAPSLRFVAMGDTGTGDPGQYKIANAISAKCAKDGCDFIQLLGDNLYDTGASSVNDPIWAENFETPYAAINLDFWAVLGNHDYGASGAGTDFLKGQNEVDYAAKSTKWKMPASYYHHVKGNAELFALDTNMALFSLAGQQKTDMNGWIAASKADWKIAFGHHPYKSNGPHGNAGKYDGVPIPPINGNAVKSFLEGTICGKVDVYFCGHDHSQQWLNESCSGTELAVSGAGAKTTELTGNNPALFQSLELGFLYVTITGKKLVAQFIDENGAVEFTHTINKP